MWNGSCAKSLRDALSRKPHIELDSIEENLGYHASGSLCSRITNRLLVNVYKRRIRRDVFDAIKDFKPDVFIAYKGNSLNANIIKAIRQTGIKTINIYPDCSPLAYGKVHFKSVSEYDLILSSKPYHPELWRRLYGLSNTCLYIPHAYDPGIHLANHYNKNYDYDIGLAATCRSEYLDFMVNLSDALKHVDATVAIAGNGWGKFRKELPEEWSIENAVTGKDYIQWLRKKRICIAPLTRNVSINGEPHPGDEDTTRTYELGAGYCFYLHQRTDYLKRNFSESAEIPMFDNTRELVDLIKFYLPRENERELCASGAHNKIVPRFSYDSIADLILRKINEHFK